MTTHDPRAWRVAIALGLESGLDWARWAAGWTAPCVCAPYRGDDALPRDLVVRIVTLATAAAKAMVGP